MKNYLKSSIALGLLFFTLPTLAMEDQPDKPQVTKVLNQIVNSLYSDGLPNELTSQIVANFIRYEDFPNADYSNAFYSHDFRPYFSHLKSVKSVCLNFRGTCRKWRDAIDPLFKLIPTLQEVSPGQDVLYPSLLSIVKFDLLRLTPEAVEEQCRYLSNPDFKNLVFFQIVQYPTRKMPRRKLTERDMKALSSLLQSHAEDVKYLALTTLSLSEDNAKIFAPVLPQLKNLEWFKFNMFCDDKEAFSTLSDQFSSLKSLKNIFWDGVDGERECTAMVSALPKLPNLEKIFIKGKVTFSYTSEELFYNFRTFNNIKGDVKFSSISTSEELFDDLRTFYNDFLSKSTFVTDEIRKQLIDAIQAHPNKKLLCYIQH